MMLRLFVGHALFLAAGVASVCLDSLIYRITCVLILVAFRIWWTRSLLVKTAQIQLDRSEHTIDLVIARLIGGHLDMP
jgi:hypothetical protein